MPRPELSTRPATAQRTRLLVAGPETGAAGDLRATLETLASVTIATDIVDGAVLAMPAAQIPAGAWRAYLRWLHLMGIAPVAIIVYGTDAAGIGRAEFDALRQLMEAAMEELDLPPCPIVPVGPARANEDRPTWHDGPNLVDALDRFRPAAGAEARPLRLSVNETCQTGDGPVLLGHVLSGRLATGDEVLFSPSNQVGRVGAIAVGETSVADVGPGLDVRLTLDNRTVGGPGDILSPVDSPPIETDVFRARLMWLGAEAMEKGRTYAARIGGAAVALELQSVGGPGGDAPDQRVEPLEEAEVVLRATGLIALDEFSADPRTGRVVIVEDGEAVGGGRIDMTGYPDQRGLVTVRATNVVAVGQAVDAVARQRHNGHRGGVLWFTGLPGSGKSTLAQAVEKALFERDYQVYVLDGDNLRHGLNADLGFSPEDRAENIRRVGETAALFADAGMVVLSAFISPYRADRARARKAAERVSTGESFHEVYIDADLATCEARDPKGHYARARRGEISDFTGISAPYEAPDSPDLVVETADRTVADCVDQITAYIERNFRVAT